MTTIRPGGAGDVPAVLGLMDGAVEWLAARGRTGQWGTARQSTDPRRIATFTSWAEAGELWVAERDGAIVGGLAVGAAPAHVPPAAEPERYVNLLIGHGVGRALLDHARDLARAAGVALLRVDCYAGDDRALVRYYEREGFTATEPFTVDTPRGPWPGQVLEQRVRAT